MQQSINKYFVCVLFFYCALTQVLVAQQLDRNTSSSAGRNKTVSGITVSYNIGESIVFSGTGTNVILSQGFEQPEATLITSSLSSNPKIEVVAFPNPVSDHLFIQIKKLKSISDIEIHVIDINGKETNMKKTNTSVLSDYFFTLDFSMFAAGVYFLKLSSSGNHFVETLKIIKS
ncbi:MAG: hypothetical protein A3F72_13680 [Bacteroidetes bacterium RIFCSPLOWO2_12_FULL_35_15]|nr:MAG: hypothetical protein A3F72_13680 [Bacteroidetes bacterium RIFCSPLOWO2_12_FULL_35_15]